MAHLMTPVKFPKKAGGVPPVSCPSEPLNRTKVLASWYCPDAGFPCMAKEPAAKLKVEPKKNLLLS